MSTDFQTAILREAEKMGLNPANLSKAQFTMLGIRVRSTLEKIQAGAKAVISRTKTTLGIQVVLPQIATENEAICTKNTCGKFRILKSGDPACDACTCSASMLRAKWRDAKQMCPLPVPLWDNNGKPCKSDEMATSRGDGYA